MLDISPIAAFSDNYIWLLKREGCGSCAVVDPGDEDPVIERLDAAGLSLSAILITHKHGDHAGGVRGLKARWPQAVVFGPANEPIATLDHRLSEGDLVRLDDLGVSLSVLDVPGHTEGHLAYYTEGVLFCGDTLFAAGCGRVFSGTFDQLSDSLSRIGALPPDTLVYCAHEYTLDNLGFAKWVEPDNPELLRREQQDRESRRQGNPTVPSTIGLELSTNPFLRTDQQTVIAAAEKWAGQPLTSRRQVFRAVRQWKDKAYD